MGRPPPSACAKPAFCSKTAVKPAFWPPDGQDALQTSLLAPKTASGRASWRPRRAPDGPPGVHDGLCTGLLALKTALNGSLLDVFALLTVSLCLHDSSLDETSGRSTWLPINVAACRLASIALCDGVTLVLYVMEKIRRPPWGHQAAKTAFVELMSIVVS